MHMRRSGRARHAHRQGTPPGTTTPAPTLGTRPDSGQIEGREAENDAQWFAGAGILITITIPFVFILGGSPILQAIACLALVALARVGATALWQRRGR